jgi:LysM repeat protein
VTGFQYPCSLPTVKVYPPFFQKKGGLRGISKKFNITNAELLKSNAAVLVKELRTGQKLKLLVDNNQSAS